jgi:hypothetical protein
MNSYTFPKWTNYVKYGLAVIILTVPAYTVAFVYYAASPETTNVGYAPNQPIPYSHALHAGELGIDCRYCHNTVEQSAKASIPATETCMNCHSMIKTDSPKILPLKESINTNLPIDWVRVHDLPDYAYFDHSAHVTRGVGCVSCHQRVDKMEVVFQAEPLSMGWCLECHRNPEPHLRPLDKITDMDWVPEEEEELELGIRLRKEYSIKPSVDCSTCHR